MAVVNGRSDLRERSTGELVRELSEQVSTLARQEVELAKAELAEKGRHAGLGAGLLGGAAVAGLATVGALTTFLIAVLAIPLPLWAAALVVTGIWAAIAGLLAMRGRERMERMGAPMPEKTVDSVKEDVQWLKGQTRSAGR